MPTAQVLSRRAGSAFSSASAPASKERSSVPEQKKSSQLSQTPPAFDLSKLPVTAPERSETTSSAEPGVLRIAPADSALEREADRFAGSLADSMPSHWTPLSAPLQINRKCAACKAAEEEEHDTMLHRKPSYGSASGQPAATPSAPSIVHDVLRSPGQPLSAETRSFFEPRLGSSLSHVRVHADATAAASARSVEAQAYAVGSDIVFDHGAFTPETQPGRQLLAHELAHVVQQKAGGRRATQLHRQPKANAAKAKGGNVLFVTVESSKDEIIFVTDKGSLVYHLLAPVVLPMGAHTFNVQVTKNNLQLTAPSDITSFAGFKYSIGAGQPNPADLLRSTKTVTVIVGSGTSSGAQDSAASLPSAGLPSGGGGGQQTVNLPVTFTAVPDNDFGFDPSGVGSQGGRGLASRLPTPLLGGAGIGLHSAAFNDLSWLNGSSSRSYFEPLIPRSGIDLGRSLNEVPRDLKTPLQTYLENGGANSKPLAYRNPLSGEPYEFNPDAGSALKRPYSAQELLSIDSLARRYNAGEVLSSSETQLLRSALGTHIGSSSPTSPFTSYSKPDVRVNFPRKYRVRVNVDRGAALDASGPNALNEQGVLDAITNVEEAEFSVVGDQSGRIISVQKISALEAGGESFLVRNAGAIRWGGRIALVLGAAYSVYKVATADPEERTHVAAMETGGFLGSIGGGALGTAACVGFGIVTEGIGLFFCGLAGGIGGGLAGNYLGGSLGGANQQQGDALPPGSEHAFDEILGDSYPLY